MAPVIRKKMKAPLSVEAQRAVMGKWVKCTQIMERVYVPREGEDESTRWRNNRHQYEWRPKDVPQFKGWIVGFRWKLNGYTSWIGSEEGNEFVQTGRVFVCLVCKDPRHEPVCIPWPETADTKKEEQNGETSNSPSATGSSSGQ